MRLTALLSPLLLIPAPLFAQDDDGPAGEPETIEETPIEGSEAADLFFRAFWIEQSGGKNAEAEMLYRKLIKAHPDSEEAPRAYLALIRLSAAKGIAADDLLRALEKGYPKSKKEIELARRLAARLRTDFDPAFDETDTPVMRKIKTIQLGLTRGGIKAEDRDFLADIGSVGYPMLAYTLRSHASAAVKITTDVLAGQHSEEANAVLAAALLDPTVLYRMTIVDTLRSKRAYAKSLMKALHTLWPTASRSMRVRIARVWCGGTWKDSPSSEDCYGYLVLALKDKNEDVRRSAIHLGDPLSHALRPKAFVAAIIPLCSNPDPKMRQMWQWLPWQLGHAELAPALTKVLIEHPDELHLSMVANGADERVDDATAIAMARVVVGRYRKRAPDRRDANSSTKQYAVLAAVSSGAAARVLLEEGMQLGSRDITSAVMEGVWKRGVRPATADTYIRDAVALRRRAIRLAYDPAKGRAADGALSVLGLRAEDFDAALAAAKAHPEKGLLSAAYQGTFLASIGPVKAAALAPYAKSLTAFYESAAKSWSTPGQSSGQVDDSAFWSVVLPLMDPARRDDMKKIRDLARGSKRHADVVATWILDERGSKWGWRRPADPSRRDHGGTILRYTGVLEALARDPLRGKFYALTGDDRHDLGYSAVRAARRDTDAASLIAFANGVKSPWPKVRSEALKGLATRGALGAVALVQVLDDAKTPDDVRREAIDALGECATKEQLPYVKRRLDARPDDPEAHRIWGIAFDLDRDGTTERALAEVFGPGAEQFRYQALVVLGDVSDERRIPIFRRVLRQSSDHARVHRVLRTVADQYLIELGPEVLLHLRSPHAGIRQTATTAIERLKFYAEAKKLFDDEKPKK